MNCGSNSPARGWRPRACRMPLSSPGSPVAPPAILSHASWAGPTPFCRPRGRSGGVRQDWSSTDSLRPVVHCGDREEAGGQPPSLLRPSAPSRQPSFSALHPTDGGSFSWDQSGGGANLSPKPSAPPNSAPYPRNHGKASCLHRPQFPHLKTSNASVTFRFR